MLKIKQFFTDRFRGLLSDKHIRKLVNKKTMIRSSINPIMDNDERYQPNSFDITLSPFTRNVTPNDRLANGDRCINVCKEFSTKDPAEDVDTLNENIVIMPGEFKLMSCNERFNLPNGIVGFVCGRSSIARIGLQIEQAGLIDTGFKGTITFEVYNQTGYPIVLKPHMRIAQVYFFKSQFANKPYGHDGSKYQNQFLPQISRISNDFNK